jgi:hypothetical protein
MAIIHIFINIIIILKSQSQAYFNLLNRSVIDLVQVLLRYLNYNGHRFIENALVQ